MLWIQQNRIDVRESGPPNFRTARDLTNDSKEELICQLPIGSADNVWTAISAQVFCFVAGRQPNSSRLS